MGYQALLFCPDEKAARGVTQVLSELDFTVEPCTEPFAAVKKLQGTVVLQAIIDKQGKVDSLQMVSGDPLLAQAAADAVKQWRYKPYSHNGDPVEFQTRVTVDFKLP